MKLLPAESAPILVTYDLAERACATERRATAQPSGQTGRALLRAMQELPIAGHLVDLPKCAGLVTGVGTTPKQSPCPRAGKFEHEGRIYCNRHIRSLRLAERQHQKREASKSQRASDFEHDHISPLAKLPCSETLPSGLPCLRRGEYLLGSQRICLWHARELLKVVTSHPIPNQVLTTTTALPKKAVTKSRPGRRSFISEEQKQEILTAIEARALTTTREIGVLISMKYNITYSKAGLIKLAKQLRGLAKQSP